MYTWFGERALFKIDRPFFVPHFSNEIQLNVLKILHEMMLFMLVSDRRVPSRL
jgi:hypothetical protein